MGSLLLNPSSKNRSSPLSPTKMDHRLYFYYQRKGHLKIPGFTTVFAGKGVSAMYGEDLYFAFASFLLFLFLLAIAAIVEEALKERINNKS